MEGRLNRFKWLGKSSNWHYYGALENLNDYKFLVKWKLVAHIFPWRLPLPWSQMKTATKRKWHEIETLGRVTIRKNGNIFGASKKMLKYNLDTQPRFVVDLGWRIFVWCLECDDNNDCYTENWANLKEVITHVLTVRKINVWVWKLKFKKMFRISPSMVHYLKL